MISPDHKKYSLYATPYKASPHYVMGYRHYCSILLGYKLRFLSIVLYYRPLKFEM